MHYTHLLIRLHHTHLPATENINKQYTSTRHSSTIISCNDRRPHTDYGFDAFLLPRSR